MIARKFFTNFCLRKILYNSFSRNQDANCFLYADQAHLVSIKFDLKKNIFFKQQNLIMTTNSINKLLLCF